MDPSIRSTSGGNPTITDFSLPPGTRLKGGLFQIERKLGQGGFGITYLVRRTDQAGGAFVVKEMFLSQYSTRASTRTEVTVHTIEPGRFETFKKKFVDEGNFLMQFDHPNIVRAFDVFEENNTVYLVLQYVKGRSLKEIIQQVDGAMPYDSYLPLLRQVSSALRYLHGRNCIHRDITPANIMVEDSTYNVKLIDFGISKQVDADALQTHTHTRAGADYYAPIEQLSGTAPKPTLDVYGLAATSYFCLIGKPPAGSAHYLQTPMGDLRDLKPEIPVSASNAIRKGMSAMPDNRFQSIQEFFDAFEGKNPPAWNPGANTSGPFSDETQVASGPSGGHSGSWQPGGGSPQQPQARPVSPPRKKPNPMRSVLQVVLVALLGGGLTYGAIRFLDGYWHESDQMLLESKSKDNARRARLDSLKNLPKVLPKKVKKRTEEWKGKTSSVLKSEGTKSHIPESEFEPSTYRKPDQTRANSARITGDWRTVSNDFDKVIWRFGSGGDVSVIGTVEADEDISVKIVLSGRYAVGNSALNIRYSKVQCLVTDADRTYSLREYVDYLREYQDTDEESIQDLENAEKIFKIVEGETESYTISTLTNSQMTLIGAGGNRLNFTR